MYWPWMIVTNSILWVLAISVFWEVVQGHSLATILVRSSIVILVFSSFVLVVATIILKYLYVLPSMTNEAEEKNAPSSQATPVPPAPAQQFSTPTRGGAGGQR